MSTTPADDATDVAPSADIVIVFDSEVVASAAAFTIACPQDVDFDLTVSEETYRLDPTEDLPHSAVCTVTVDASAVTANGIGLSADYVFGFTVVDVDGPEVSSVVPADGALDVAIDAEVVITFSEDVVVGTGAFGLECPSGSAVAFATSGSATRYTLTPSATLPPGTACVVSVQGDAVQDSDENDSPNYTFTFQTPAAPTLVSTLPGDLAADVPPAAALTVTFSTAVSVTEAAFALECLQGGAVELDVAPAGPATTYTLTPATALPAGVPCEALIRASGVTAQGVPLASDHAWGFTTLGPPTVVSTTPAEGSVGHSGAISVTFSEGVNVPSAAAFSLECPVGTPQGFTVTTPAPLPAMATTVVITPAGAPQAGSIACEFTVFSGSITDGGGNDLVANHVLHFVGPE